MNSLLNPKWIIVINVAPVLLLLIMQWNSFEIIKTELENYSQMLWYVFMGALFMLTILNITYASWLIKKKKEINIIYAALILLSNILFIYLYNYFFEDILPWSIPNWMVSKDLQIYTGTFLIPTLAHAIYIFVDYFTAKMDEQYAWQNFLKAAGIPIAWYVFSQLVFPLWGKLEGEFSIHLVLILMILSIIWFFFYLVRAVVVLVRKRHTKTRAQNLPWMIIISIIFPLLGLAINNGHLSKDLGNVPNYIFGDFSSAWFYLIALTNGVLVCLPTPANRNLRLALHLGRSLTLSYIFYFFLVFLPYLPLSIVAVIVIGVGFLLLTPLFLFILQSKIFMEDYNDLKNQFSKTILLPLTLIALIILPASLLYQNLHHRSTLNQALDYVYNPNYQDQDQLDSNSLQHTLDEIKFVKNRNFNSVMQSRQPYLSAIFNYLVLDNLSLSDAKINKLEAIFFDKEFEFAPEFFNPANDGVRLTSVNTKSVYNSDEKYWTSWMDLNLENMSVNRTSEYATKFELPVGCWISDYYLYVGDRKEHGLLCEKKSALWIYNNITRTRKDPGILYYLGGNEIGFRVFPFGENEKRRTGIEFIHKEPVEFTFDGQIVQLGNESEGNFQTQTAKEKDHYSDQVSYLSAETKSTLEKIKRAPYYHFLIDCSTSQADNINTFQGAIHSLSEQYPDLVENGKVSFVNSYHTTSELTTEWQLEYQKIAFAGGLFLDRAISSELIKAHLERKDTYPIFVVLTDHWDRAILDKNFADLAFTLPESSIIYHSNGIEGLTAHNLLLNPKMSLDSIVTLNSTKLVLSYQNPEGDKFFIANDQQGSLIFKDQKQSNYSSHHLEKSWATGLHLAAHYHHQLLYPKNNQHNWLELIKQSFASKIMTPFTSYIVVETEAQKATLIQKQKEVLSGNKNLDLNDDTRRMSEPNIWIMLLLIMILYFWDKKRKLNKSQIG